MQTARIMAVDDRPENLETIQALLDGEGELELWNDAKAALTSLQNARSLPDVLLLDVMMPDLDGFAFVRNVRESETARELPVLLVTSLDDRDARIEGLRSGADDFISRPFDRTELLARIRTILRLGRMRRREADQARFAWVAEEAGEGYALLDANDRILYANAKARGQLGLEEHPGEARFLERAQASFELEPEIEWRDWNTASASSGAARYLVRPAARGADALWLAVEFQTHAAPEPRRLVRLRDVTRSLALRRDIWKFSLLVQHKLRTPLTGLLGSLEWLESDLARGDADPARLAESAGFARQSAERLHGAVEKVLRFAELPGRSAGAGAPGTTLANWLELAGDAARELDLPLVCDCAPQGCDAATPVTPESADLILRELFQNSVKFHPARRPSLELRAAVDGEWIRLIFQNDGASVPEDLTERVWAPYFQAERYFSGETPGMGLGLAMVASLVSECGGRYSLRNRSEGAGVRAELRFPRLDAASEQKTFARSAAH